jgi:hypothetical protein
MTQPTLQLVERLKENDQDFEFYPTTDQIIGAMVRDMRKIEYVTFETILDIGAGNGGVLRKVRSLFRQGEERDCSFGTLYAIEKSPILCQQLDADIFIVGTEFMEQSLLSKQVDVVFSNPPYSTFEEWAVKILREAAAPVVYLVIPTRWQDSIPIADALKFRDAKTEIVGTFDFLNAERQARAVVHLLRIQLANNKDDAFERFFNEEFAELRARFVAPKDGEEDSGEEKDRKAKEDPERDARFGALVIGEGYPSAMVELYNQEMANVRRNYELVAKLDANLLREFDITPTRILKCLKERLAGLRNVYWNELFSRMTAVTDRLCSKKRSALLGTLREQVYVDFTVSNIHAIILWIIKNASAYLDQQLVETYERMIDKANVHMYKSNHKVFTADRWRYKEEKPTHFYLDYRLVLHYCGHLVSNYSGKYRMDETGCEFLQDLHTIARNLGFRCNTTDYRLQHTNKWEPGQVENFEFIKDDKRLTLFEVRAFKNGNFHVRLNQQFALALNVEHGRIQGWISTPAEAAEELKDPQAAKYFNTHYALPSCSNTLLLAAAA